MPTIRKVQKPVPGLAKFTGVESQGVLGMEFSNLIQPVIEVDDYLGPNGYSQLDDPAVPQNGSIGITVPENRFWRLKWVSVTVDTPLGVQTNAIINVVPLESGLSFQLNPPFQTQTGVGLTWMFKNSEASGYGVDAKGVNARPGDIVQAQLVNGSGAGNNRVRLFVQYQELQL